MGVKINIKEIIIEIEYLLILTLVISCISTSARIYLEQYYICLLFLAFHELAHILVATFLSKILRKILFSISGLTAYFKYEYEKKEKIYYIKDIIIYLAGPVSNIIIACIFRNAKFVCEVNIFLAFLNLLPIYPLDGFNILKSILCVIYNERKKLACKISKIISVTVLILLSIILTILFFYYKNISSIVFLLYILFINIKNV